MKDHASVVIIGGGIVGCAAAYWLTRMGWRDVMLVEKTELTAGTTWHSTSLIHLLEKTENMTKACLLSFDLFNSLEAETGQPVGLRLPGRVRLGKNREDMVRIESDKARARKFGIDLEVIGPDEVRELFPLAVTDGLEGGAFTAKQGHIDPSMTTHAMAKGARDRGAEIVRGVRVTGLEQKRAGDWEVITAAGTIQAEIVVNAAGIWAPEIGAMIGLTIPIASMERQYIVTDTVPEIEGLARELPTLSDFDAPFYFRQEGDGLLFGVYEADVPFCFEDGIPPHFGMELLQPNLDRSAEQIEAGMKRVPAFGRVGIKRVVCGPTGRTPDINPLVGPPSGIRNFYMLAGFTTGMAQGPGVAQLLAEWIVEGEPSVDLTEIDVNRFGPFATRRYLRSMLVERHHFGSEDATGEREGGRPAKTSAVYHRLKGLGVRYGARFGWECPLWFAPASGGGDGDTWRKAVAAECRGVREGVGLLDLTSLAKYEVSGPGAEAYLDRLLAGALPGEIGGVAAGLMLTPRGGINCQVTVVRMAPDRFYLTAGASAELHHLGWLKRHDPGDGSVRIDNLSGRYGTFVLAGPRSGDVLARITDADVSASAFPWATAREIAVEFTPVTAVRFNFIGEDGWELHHPLEYQAPLFEVLIGAGEEIGMVNFGMKALDALRLEKAWPLWGAELSADVTPAEARLEGLVAMDKGDFVGREALVELGKKAVERRLACLVIEAGDFEAGPGAPVYDGDELVAMAASAGYGYSVGKGLALAHLPARLMESGRPLEIEAGGRRHAATVSKGAVFDPGNTRVLGGAPGDRGSGARKREAGTAAPATTANVDLGGEGS